MATYTVTTTTGRQVTRTSDAPYVAAAERGPRVTFHRTVEAARAAAGPYGHVHMLAAPQAPAPAQAQQWVAYDAQGNEVGRGATPPEAMQAARAAGHTVASASRA